MYRNYSITPLHSSGIGNKVVHLNTRTPSYHTGGYGSRYGPMKPSYNHGGPYHPYSR